MKFTVQSVTGFVATLLLATQVFAGNNAPTSSSTATSSTTATPSPIQAPTFSGFIQGSRSTNLYDFQDGTRHDGMDYSARFSLRLSKNYLLRLDAGYSQDLNNAESADPMANDFSDTSLSLLRAPVPVGKLLMLGYQVGVVAPTSKASHTLQNLQGAVSTGLTAMINPDRLIQGLSLAAGLSLRRSFHQYDTATNGSVNVQYSSTQSLSLGYQWASGFSISGQFLHRNGLTYQNNIKESFEHVEELGYAINDTVEIAAGHTNAGSALKANGTDSNIALVNENDSTVYASLTLNF